MFSKEDAKEIHDLSVDAVIDAIEKAADYLEAKKFKMNLYEYPVEDFKLDDSDKFYSEFKDKIQYVTYKIPRFNMKKYVEGKIDYRYIFKSNFTQDGIEYSSIRNFNKIVDFVLDHKELLNMFSSKQEHQSVVWAVQSYISSLVERYMYCFCRTQKDKKEFVSDLVISKLRRYLDDSLPIKICIPICLATFEDDYIEISNGISIQKISYEFQKARCKAGIYEAIKEEWVSLCTTHMLVLENYSIPNKEYDSINQITRNHSSFPLNIVNKFFAAIRICTGYTTGYGQLLVQPIGWADSWFADLEILYGTTYQAFNPNESQKFWMLLQVSRITPEMVENIKATFLQLNKKREKKEESEFRKIDIAVQRLNRCLLREEIDDTALDAIIGIEMLLSGGTQGEITYTISNRMPVIAARIPECSYSPNEVRIFMKKIYNFRSAIVHGRELKDKEIYIVKGEKKIHVKDLAIEFLRFILIFILKNEEFLDAKKFDEELDAALLHERTKGITS